MKTKSAIICGHPLEWDAELYKEEEFNRKLGMPGDRFGILKKEMELLDIWKGGEGIKGAVGNPEKNNLWFAHPVYFINHLDKAGLLDKTFNPYEGKVFKPRQATDNNERLLAAKNVNEVKDNPGFAPRYEEPDGRLAYEGNIFDGYAVPTGYFNQEYYDPNRALGQRIYPHEGVDFRGKVERKIVSFIHGRVIMVGKMASTYAESIIVKPLNEDGIIYLLAHLSKQLVREGDIVEPRDEVAEVGDNNGTISAHLHISVLRTDKDIKDDIVSPTNSGYEWKITPNYYDPFNHSIPRETWRR